MHLLLWVSISVAPWGPQKILGSFDSIYGWHKYEVFYGSSLDELNLHPLQSCLYGLITSTVPMGGWLCVYDTASSLAFVSLPIGKGRCITNVKIKISYPANWHLLWAMSLALREKGEGQKCILKRLSGHHVGCTQHSPTHLNLGQFRVCNLNGQKNR